jgi:hypothetical protein
MTDPSTAVAASATAPMGDAKSSVTQAKHVAVVYFHGIGSQRHYEGVCHLVDQLDHTIYELGRRKGSNYEGLQLKERSARVEHLHGDDLGKEGDVVYVLARAIDDSQKRPPVTLRFYEAYWAPETVDGTTSPAVAAWLVGQINKPLQLLFGPWRAFERLRRATLVALYQRRRDDADSPDERLRDRTARLINLYARFQQPGARSDYAKGSFADFEHFIAKELKGAKDSEKATQVVLELARDWRRDHQFREWLHLLSIATVFAGGVGFIALLALISIALLATLQLHPPTWIPAWLPRPENITAELVATTVGFILSALGINRFLVDYVGDVQQYVTYEETDKRYERRRAVLDSGIRQLRHALENENCERVVVVAHSLGTAVALDTLLALWRFNRASGSVNTLEKPLPLYKIQHVITYGSPIDKINYFFSVTRSPSATYERLIEELRGDIGSPPFSKVGRQPQLHWINFWDKGDIISGPIETLASSHLRGQEVDNVRIASYVLPDLMGSHGAYLDHPQVLQDLVDVVVFGKYSYEDPPRDPDGKPNRVKLRRGPGNGTKAQSVCFVFIFLLPWLLLLSCAEIFWHWGVMVRWSLGALLAMYMVGMLMHIRRQKPFGAPPK